MLLLGLITLLAATVNGALGYGFSSITVPLGVALGVPLGGQIIRRLRPETFRRICMSFDAWVVAFGLSRLQHDMHLVKSDAAYLLVLAVAHWTPGFCSASCAAAIAGASPRRGLRKLD